MMDVKLDVFFVRRDDGLREDTNQDVLGWGVQFPSGLCVLDWNIGLWPKHSRLDNPHLSEYGSIEDVETAVGGSVEIVETHELPRVSGKVLG